MGRLIDALLRRAKRGGLRRGLSGEHWAWFLVAGAAWLFDRVRQPDDVSTTIALRPGDRYLVTVVPRGNGGRRRPRGRAGRGGGAWDGAGAGGADLTDGPDRSDAE